MIDNPFAYVYLQGDTVEYRYHPSFSSKKMILSMHATAVIADINNMRNVRMVLTEKARYGWLKTFFND